MCTMAHVRRSEDKWELILSLHHMGSGTELSSITLGGKCPYPLSHPPSPGRADLKDFDFSKILRGTVAHACIPSPGMTEAGGL